MAIGKVALGNPTVHCPMGNLKKLANMN